MTDAARTAPAYAEVRVREPAGERKFGASLTIGGPGSDVIVPGASDVGLHLQRRDGTWTMVPRGEPARVNGRLLSSARDLRQHDVIAVGDAQVIVIDVSRTLLRIDVHHLVGNATASPAGALSNVLVTWGDEDVPIPVQKSVARFPPLNRSRARSAWMARIAAAVGLVFILAASFYALSVPVALEVDPADARVRVSTWPVVRWGSELRVLPGRRTFRAEHTGYRPAQVSLEVARGQSTAVRLALVKLPGELEIDTGGIAATVSLDGVEVGRAPGTFPAEAGQHTILLQAPRYVVDLITVTIDGAGRRQRLKATLHPSWGTLHIASIPAGARVNVDAVDAGVTPTVVDAPSGVRHISIAAPGFKTWETSLVLKGGEALTVGPVVLGPPDAHLRLQSRPAGAAVIIGGALRGHTPLQADLAPGVAQSVEVSAPGYAPWYRTVTAKSDERLSWQVGLSWVGGRVLVEGEPAAASVFVDGADKGRSPLELNLAAVEHRIEVRKPGFIFFETQVLPVKGVDRIVQYRLLSQDLAAAAAQRASVLYTHSGYVLRLVPAASGSDGPRRAFYLGAAEVDNEQFRRFRPDHSSAGGARANLDDQPASGVGWLDAVQFCNWLSAQDNLPPAYTRRGNTYVLSKPPTTGYRLPNEAEWAYAARVAGTADPARFEWGGHGASEWVEGATNAEAATRSHTGEDSAQTAGQPIGFRVARDF